MQKGSPLNTVEEDIVVACGIQRLLFLYTSSSG